VQQDVAPTLAAALGVQMPPTTTGRVFPVLRTGLVRPRVVMLLVLDGMRRDYFDRYSASLPTLTALRQRSAWFTQARGAVCGGGEAACEVKGPRLGIASV